MEIRICKIREIENQAQRKFRIRGLEKLEGYRNWTLENEIRKIRNSARK